MSRSGSFDFQVMQNRAADNGIKNSVTVAQFTGILDLKVNIWRELCSAPNVHFQIENAYELSYGDAVFDSVVGSSILHHLEIEPALREIRRVLKPGGTICFTEPNMLNPQIAIQKNVPWIKRWLGDTPDETAFFRLAASRLLERTGYRDVRIEPFDFLHPKTPALLINGVAMLGGFFENLPVFRVCRFTLYTGG